jgi:molybdopterin molybdotransferase
VVKIEDVLVIRDSNNEVCEIEIRDPVKPKQNWRGAGDDFQIGNVVLKPGKMISPEHILALASLGVIEVPVYKRVRVGLISTGRELVPMNQFPKIGQIRNSTAPYVISSLRNAGVDIVHLGTIPDAPEVFHSTMLRVLQEDFDILLTTGAVSMGKFDFVTEGLTRLDAEIFFHKVAIRPGKPILFGQIGNGPIIFGLPGNPVSGVVGLRFFVDPYLRELNRMKPERPMKAKLSITVQKPEGLRCFFKSHLTVGEQGPIATIIGGQMSFMVGSLLNSTAWTILPEESGEIAEGATVDVYPMSFSPYDWRENHKTHSTHDSKGGCC